MFHHIRRHPCVVKRRGDDRKDAPIIIGIAPKS
jgi:hypothetical protein